ncbi:hypothetical protein BDV36DRAFT_304538 [Aspergillus pseudocaelatus]|uniref:F-box domain-containing protein n=1 Tax=Aspergillus pseudocaelatus TaxID=1825620 RepID=A0ABQ6W7C7_9EURO|nr:hypothetical protein BDV36DRAFT_304538 [Aspergillus pseudocaelatus]
MESVTIEALPPEVKTVVLYAIPDLLSLNALVIASPSFHALYLSQRKQLLSTILERCLQIPVMKYLGQKLDVYQVFASMAEDDLLEMAPLHTIVEFILEDMVNSFLELRPDTQKPKEEKVVLSPSETFRMQRALYRLEIHRLLFNNRDLPSFDGLDYFEDVHPDDNDQWIFFLSLFSPWEMEEIRCVLKYMFRAYEELPGATVFDDWCELSPDENEDPLSHLYDHSMINITG